MRDRAHRAGGLLACSIAWIACTWAQGAEAVDGVDPSNEPTYARPGLYVGVGGTAAFPRTWNSGFDDDLNEEVSEIANQNAIANRDAIPSGLALDEMSVFVNGAELEDSLLGINGLVGYRVGEKLAVEIEAEWLVDSNDSNLDVTSQTDGNGLPTASTGLHRAEVRDIWTVTANARIYPPLTGRLAEWTEHRIQPFVKIGVGVQHSKLDIDLSTSGLATTDALQTIVVSGDFQFRARESNTDGAVRVAGGIDFYATENIVAEINVGYVAPFAKVGSIYTEFLALQWRLLYRF